METDYARTSIFHIARADFLQRIRSYYFLIAIGVCIFVMYSFVPPVNAGYTMVSLGNYRGFYNSAWIGSMVAMCIPFFALVGFYLVNNSVKRDEDTGVGQIIATTRISKVQYLTGKLFSNFAVLLVMLAVIAVMTVVMFMVRGETNQVELGKLLLPLLILTVPGMFIIAALGLFFDSLSGISRGFMNIAYFFVWVFLVSGGLGSQATDVFAVNTGMLEIQKSIAGAHPDWNNSFGTGIIIRDKLGSCKVFTWDGMTWTPGIILQRIFWMAMAFGLVLLGSLRFNRFDASEKRERKQTNLWFRKKREIRTDDVPMPLQTKYRELPPAKARFSFYSLVKAELLMTFRGKTTLWMVLTAGLFAASLFAPLEFAHKFALPLVWFLQILTLSKLGSREVTSRCNEYIFSAPSPLWRQLPATFSAAVLILLALAIPVLLRTLLTGNFYGVFAVMAGALFVPAFAILSGILTRGSKLFEVIFTIMVYGILNSVPWFDFVGATRESQEMGMAQYLAVITLALILLAFSGRRWQISHAS